jgi:hypothetical protein
MIPSYQVHNCQYDGIYMQVSNTSRDKRIHPNCLSLNYTQIITFFKIPSLINFSTSPEYNCTHEHNQTVLILQVLFKTLDSNACFLDLNLKGFLAFFCFQNVILSF